ncbi:MAG: glutamyl-tRNA reductase [Fidelibacterota bacterium]
MTVTGSDRVDRILCMGINHRTAPIQIREQYSLSESEISHMYKALPRKDVIPELFVLSTCNRTEIYGLSDQSGPFVQWVSTMFRELGKPPVESSRPPFVLIRGNRAVLHLLRVTAGMDSMMLGETQIAAQVKRAFSRARKAGTTGIILNRLIQMSLEAGKRVRSETSLSGGAMSVSYAAVEQASEIFPDLSQAAVLLVGAGNVGRLTASYFRKKGVTRFFVSNRSRSRGEALAQDLDGTYVSPGDVLSVLPKVQIAVTCTSSREPQLTLEALIGRGKTKQADLLLLDLSVPRNVDPAAHDLQGITLFAVDDLESVVAHNIARRERELPAAEEIIGEVSEKFSTWVKTLAVAPMIRELTENLRRVKKREMMRVRNSYPEEVVEAVDRVSDRLIRRLLKGPISALKSCVESDGDPSQLVDTVRFLYKLKVTSDNE